MFLLVSKTKNSSGPHQTILTRESENERVPCFPVSALEESKMSTIFLTPDQIAERLQVETDTVRVWLAAGKMKGTKLTESKRSRWRVSEENFNLFIKRRTN
jgi:excisionase family DNA binding protein